MDPTLTVTVAEPVGLGADADTDTAWQVSQPPAPVAVVDVNLADHPEVEAMVAVMEDAPLEGAPEQGVQFGLTILLTIAFTQLLRRRFSWLNADKGMIAAVAGIVATSVAVAGGAVVAAVWGEGYSVWRAVQLGTSAGMVAVISYYGADKLYGMAAFGWWLYSVKRQVAADRADAAGDESP